MRVRVTSQAGAVPQEGHKVSLGGSRVVRQSYGVPRLLGGWSPARSSLRSEYAPACSLHNSPPAVFPACPCRPLRSL